MPSPPPPAAPGNLQLNINSSRIRLTWDAATGSPDSNGNIVDNYFVFRGPDSSFGNAEQIATVSGDQLLYNDLDTTANVVYYYFVQSSSNENGEGAPAAAHGTSKGPHGVTSTKPPPPVISPAQGFYDSRVVVTLTPDDENAKIYYAIKCGHALPKVRRYTVPFVVDRSATVRAVVVLNNRVSVVAQAAYKIRQIPSF